MVDEQRPRYPDARVISKSRKPLALFAATRQALRRAGVPQDEMERFSADAASVAHFSDDGPDAGTDTLIRVCSRWAKLDEQSN